MDEELEYLDSLNIIHTEPPKRNILLTIDFWKSLSIKVYLFFYLFFYSLIFGQRTETATENDPQNRENRRVNNPPPIIRRGNGMNYRYRSRGGG